MHHTKLRDRLLEEIAARATELGLNRARLQMVPVISRGGFINVSYHVTDGARAIHIKIATEPRRIANLRIWRSIHTLLETRYHAPRMLTWITIEKDKLEGVAFEFISGQAPEQLTDDLLVELRPMLERLHADGELAERIASPARGVACSSTLTEIFIRRFRGDLRHVEDARPSFVTDEVIEAFHKQVAEIAAQTESSAAFLAMATSPIHGDLGLNNLLVRPDREWRVLDWDGVRIGDPACDWAMLLGPREGRLRPVDLALLPTALAADSGFRERLLLYERATWLDLALDSVADYVDADLAFEQADLVRSQKRAVHRAAWDAYRQFYIRDAG